jgi:hypothetical protein|tara:strand:+ start:104 stop:556 length:453 start_codon:yes stop_codon:yes gene_type:complete
MLGHALLRNSLLTICSVVLLSGCAALFDDIDRPVNALVCDNFLIYDMCAQDMDADGVVEYVYFENSDKVFLYRVGTQEGLPANLKMHRCAQEMDDSIVSSASRMFYVSDETPYIERTDIRGAMMLSYISYMPRVASCNVAADQAQTLSEC